jgi:chromosome segregation ATPase
MNMPIKFDTLEYARKLAESGIPADQAEAQANALSDVLAEATVAPSELVLLRTDMITRIEMLRTDIYAKLEALEQRFNTKLEALEERVNAKLEALEQRLIARFNAKFVTLYWMVGISLTLHVVTLGVLLKMFSRLP